MISVIPYAARVAAGGMQCAARRLSQATRALEITSSFAFRFSTKASVVDAALLELQNAGTAVRDKPAASGTILSTVATLDYLTLKSKPDLTQEQCLHLGNAYFSGDETLGISKDATMASKVWLLGAQKGCRSCLLFVACCCIDGIGAFKNEEAKGESILRVLLREAGFPERTARREGWPAYILAMLLLRRVLISSGLPANGDLARLPETVKMTPVLQEVVTLLQYSLPDVAVLGSTPSAHSGPVVLPSFLALSRCFRYGLGVLTADETRADVLLDNAARFGDPLALVEKAVIEGRRAGAPLAASAMIWWRKAAQAGHVVAMHNVGVWYLIGEEGRLPDLKSALLWFEAAAKAGFPRSCINAAAIHAAGSTGVPQDLQRATILLERAISLLSAQLALHPSSSAKVVLERMQAVAKRRLHRLRPSSDGDYGDEDAMDADVVVQLNFSSEAARDAALHAAAQHIEGFDVSGGAALASQLVKEYADGKGVGLESSRMFGPRR